MTLSSFWRIVSFVRVIGLPERETIITLMEKNFLRLLEISEVSLRISGTLFNTISAST